MKRLLLATALIAATAAGAHQLRVFAFVEDGTIVVESKFSTGKVPVLGEVRIFDAEDALLFTLPLAEDGTARLPLSEIAVGDGLRIVVETGEGHEDYWVLTQADLQGGES